MEMFALAICSTLFSLEPQAPTRNQQETCIDVIEQTIIAKQDPFEVAAMAWTESRFVSKAKSAKGAVGPLQVLPRYWCKSKKRCDPVRAGLRAWSHYRYGRTLKETLCRYATGRACRKTTGGPRYARKVKKTLRVLVVEHIPRL